ncbi:MAG: hypothetical protein IIB81_03950 [Nanoarchaeota archaeon]|nr:hypothetical protein [Nanoarchaeota archaeon]
MQIYRELLNEYEPQGWWPIVNDKTLLCEYNKGAPRNEKEALEICFGAILTQGTQWYPNVVRAIQQLKLGRPFTKQELELIIKAEILQHEIFGNGEKIKSLDSKNKSLLGKKQIYWKNVEKAIINLNKNNLINARTASGTNCVGINKILKINNKKLAKIIRSSGYHNQKAIKLKNFCQYINKNYNNDIKKFFENNIKTRESKKIENFLDTGNARHFQVNQRFSVPQKSKGFLRTLRNELLSVNGIGPETADSIILYAAKKPIFVVDAYTKRIMNRIGFKEESYDELQYLFMSNLESNERLFNEYHALLVELGKNVCKTKPLCNKCPINKKCNYYNIKAIK